MFQDYRLRRAVTIKSLRIASRAQITYSVLQRYPYRGKVCPPYTEVEACALASPLYKEHDDVYYKECIENLAKKGIILEGENHV